LHSAAADIFSAALKFLYPKTVVFGEENVNE